MVSDRITIDGLKFTFPYVSKSKEQRYRIYIIILLCVKMTSSNFILDTQYRNVYNTPRIV